MKVDLTRKEAHLLACILWELAEERASVTGVWNPLWRLTDKGVVSARKVFDKLEAANAEKDEDRNLAGSPKGLIEDAKWSK